MTSKFNSPVLVCFQRYLIYMDYFIPIVGGNALPYFKEVADEFNYVIIPYYEVYLLSEKVKEIREVNPEIKIILSSIMPDEYLEDPEIVDRFVEYALDIDADYLLAWDKPTYLNNKEESLKNTEESLEIISELRRRFDVIPLVKGAYPEHKEYACRRLMEMGFETVSIHASPYLSNIEYIGDYLRDEGIEWIQYSDEYLKYLTKLILKFPFKEVLVIGGASPKHAKEFMEMDPERVRLAGYSWYIDAGKYIVYDALREPIDIRNWYYECTCTVCRAVGPRMRRTHGYMALHNLIQNRELILYYAGEDIGDMELELYDLILETYEDLLIINDIMVGTRYSLWREALDLAQKVYPNYLVITGIPIDTYRVDSKTLREFVGWISNHIDIKVILLWRTARYHQIVLKILDSILHKHQDLIHGRIDSEDIPMREMVTRLLLTSKWSRMRIKKETWREPLEILVSLVGPVEKPISDALKDLDKWKKRETWLITDYIDQPYIDGEHKIATPGRWATNIRPPQRLKPGAIHITQKGEIKIIKKENPYYFLVRSKK